MSNNTNQLSPEEIFINDFPMDVVISATKRARYSTVGVLIDRDGLGKIFQDGGSKIVLAEEFDVLGGRQFGGVNWEISVRRSDGLEEAWLVRNSTGCKCKWRNNKLANVGDLTKVPV